MSIHSAPGDVESLEVVKSYLYNINKECLMPLYTCDATLMNAFNFLSVNLVLVCISYISKNSNLDKVRNMLDYIIVPKY